MSGSKNVATPIGEQVIVIIDAENSIGMALAKSASDKGAKIVLGTKNRDVTDEFADQIGALAVTTDASKLNDLINLKNKAIAKFGRIDTWINNAGTSLHGYLLDSDLDLEKKTFENNFWSTRYGSQVGVLAMQENGGVLINIGSEISTAAQPLLGIYSATKEAIKTFTDSLRLELRDKDINVEVCLVRPAVFNDENPEATAEAIIKCAENPQRDVYVGGPARLTAILDTFFPQVKDMMTESRMKDLKLKQRKDYGKTSKQLFSGPEQSGRQ